MKRALFPLFLALLAALSLAVPASADLIWEPDDDFYSKHWQECEYVNRSYQLAGYGGTVTVSTAPGGMSKATLDNGLQGIVQFTWEDGGVQWGYLCWVDGSDAEGWTPMDDLSLVYDCRQFMEDHAAEITRGTPEGTDFHEAVLYEYPNGTSYPAPLKEDTQYQPFRETFTALFTDENGLRWGYLGYYMGRRDKWVCLDAPMNPDLNSGVVPVSPSPAQLRGSVTVPAGPPLLLATALPAALVLLVAAALAVRRRKRKQ